MKSVAIALIGMVASAATVQPIGAYLHSTLIEPARASDELHLSPVPPFRGEPYAYSGPQFWLVETVPAVQPGIRVIDDYEDPTDCFSASEDYEPDTEGGFVTCVALDMRAEQALARAIVEYVTPVSVGEASR
jgi:hypothetical protein